jgi:hypothetical protein
LIEIPTTLMEAATALGRLRSAVDREVAAGQWNSASHADAEALGFMMLAIGDVASIEVLAKTRLTLVVAATAAARSAYETVATCSWMLAPNHGYERDRRWMALFLDERAYWTRMADEARSRNDGQPVIDAIEAEVTRIQAIIDNVQPQFDKHGLPPMKRMPTFDQQLDEIGERANYVLYKTASQLVHPSTRGLSQVRDLVSTHTDHNANAIYEWRTRPRDWTTGLMLGIHAMRLGLETLSHRLLPAKQVNSEIRQLHDAAMVTVQAITLLGP